MLTLILGPAGSGKTARLCADIARHVRARQPGNVLIVPEQYSHEAERELGLQCGDSLSLYGEVLSFTRLASRVIAETGGLPGTLLDAGGRLLVMATALEGVGARLSTYAEARNRPELQLALLEALDELTAAGVEDQTLEAAARTADGILGDKLKDLALIRGAYQAVLAQGHADPTHRLTLLALRLAQSSMARCRYYLDGFTDFTAQELAVIRAMLAAGAEVSVCLTGGEASAAEHPIPARTAAQLTRMARELSVPAEQVLCPREPQPGVMGWLADRLMGWDDRSGDARDAVTLYVCRDITRECELAAALARQLVRDRGCRWRDIAVAVRGFADYRETLEAVFARWEVPVYLSARSDVLKKPLCTLISSAFAVITGAWEYEDVFTYLKTGLSGLSRDDCDILENYVFLWSLRGSAWIRDEDWVLHPGGTRRPFTEETRAELDRLNALRRRVSAPLLALRSAGQAAFTARAQIRALTDFFTEIDLPGTLEQRTAALEKAGREALAAEYAQLWTILVEALEQMDAILGDTPMTQPHFARLLTRMLGLYDVGTIPIALDRVTAGDFDRMRRRQIRHLIVLGADDQRLPRVGSGSGIFSDDERELLLPCGIDLGTRQEGIDREMELIYNVLTLPAETLTLSYSTGSDGTGLSPAFLFSRIARLFSLSALTPDADQLMLQAPRPALELAARQRREGVQDSPLLDGLRAIPAAARSLAGLDRLARYDRGSLSPQAVAALYGANPRLSSTRIDAFSSCRFAYFLQYGLKARARRPAGFEAPELGTFMHYVLEHVAGEANEAGGFSALTDGQVDAMSDRWMEAYIHGELGDFKGRDQRFIYLFRRLITSVRQVVRDTARELAGSDFRPLDFELEFNDMTGGTEGVAITGVADRVDGWLRDGRLYLRIADYKTGKKTFSLSDIWYGRSLQMLLYLFTLRREGKARYGAEVVPAGVLYVPGRDVMLSADTCPTDQELDAARVRELRRSGLLLDDPAVLQAMEHGDTPRYLPIQYKDGRAVGDSLADPEQMELLAGHIDRTLLTLADDLKAGSILADPWYRTDTDNACQWCDFADACQFREGSDRPRYLTKLTAEEVYRRMEGEKDNA